MARPCLVVSKHGKNKHFYNDTCVESTRYKYFHCHYLPCSIKRQSNHAKFSPSLALKAYLVPGVRLGHSMSLPASCTCCSHTPSCTSRHATSHCPCCNKRNDVTKEYVSQDLLWAAVVSLSAGCCCGNQRPVIASTF